MTTIKSILKKKGGMRFTEHRPMEITGTIEGLVKNDRIHSKIFRDEHIFERELQRIFYRTWIYVGHESEIPSIGDYKSTVVGKQPVVLIRGEGGQVGAFYNRCRHRGTLLCVDDYGSSSNGFECPYHSWTYNLNGQLVGVPFRAGYPPSFSVGDYSLTPIMIDTYGGLLFVNLNPTGLSLSDHLGNAKPYIDRFLSMGGGIEVKGGVHKHAYRGNWKFIVENSVDTYHAMFAHRAFFQVVSRRSASKVEHSPIVSGQLFNTDPRLARDLGNGHSCADDGEKVHMWIYPNLGLMIHQIRVVQPIAINQTNVSNYMTWLIGETPETNEIRIRDHEGFFGPAGNGAPDDMEMFERMQLGIEALGNEWQLVSRGIGAEKVEDNGTLYAGGQAETNLRAFYRRWSVDLT